jgi:tetratricopeptide (TPR) repeat protein
VPALRARAAVLRREGSLHGLSEEWLLWLGNALGDPSPRFPGRPRWFAKVLLLRQARENPPRLSEADAEAARNLLVHEGEVAMEYGAARRTLAAWREGLRLHDPARADREAGLHDGTEAVLAAAEALKAGGDGAAAVAAFEAAFAPGRQDRIARLVVEILTDLDREPAAAVRFGERAARADPNYAPNLRALGEARLAAGDAPGAAAILARALEVVEEGSRFPSRGSAWYRYYLGRALAAEGSREAALEHLGAAALLNDTVLDYAGRDPALEALRADGSLGMALEPARRRFEE